MQFIAIIVAAVFYAVSTTAQHSRDGLETELEKERTRRILLEDNYYTIVSRLDSLTTRMSDLENKHVAEVANLTNRIGQLIHKPVAFKAHLKKSFIPLPNQLILFDDVQFNIGKAYHYGTFITPYNGTYLFSVSICAFDGHFIEVDLMRNGAGIGQVLAGDTVNGDCSSETTITELNAGDDVNVQTHHTVGGDSIYGDTNHLNSFTGILINLRT